MNFLCHVCNKEQDESFFAINRSTNRGREYKCRECAAMLMKKWRHKNPQKTKTANSKNYWRYKLKQNYGMTKEEYEIMHGLQGGVCAICGKSEGRKNSNKLFVDHEHKGGRVRGLLCCSCNSGLGMFKDDRVLIERASLYLKHSEEAGEEADRALGKTKGYRRW